MHSKQIDLGAMVSEIDELKGLLRERGCEYGSGWHEIGWCTREDARPGVAQCATCRAVGSVPPERSTE